MKCEKCGSDMRWEGPLRTGGMKCSYCALPLPVMEAEILNAQVDAYKQLFGMDTAAGFPKFTVLADYGLQIHAVQCPFCGEDFFTRKDRIKSQCPACKYIGEIE
jgi:predicted Zn-ribbon and HTH transcriptional regulator